MIIEILAQICEIFGQSTDLAEYAVVLDHFLDPEADVLLSDDDSVIGYLESKGFQRADQVGSLLNIRSQIYKPGFSERLKYRGCVTTWQELSKDYSVLVESLRLKGLMVSQWETRWNNENGPRHLAEHIWVKQGQRITFTDRVDDSSFLNRIKDLPVADQIVIHKVYSALVHHFPELYQRTSKNDLEWLENEFIDGIRRRCEIGQWMFFDPAMVTRYVEWLRDLSRIDIQRQPQDLRDIADLYFLIEYDLLGILHAIAPLFDAGSPPEAIAVERILKTWLSTRTGQWYPAQVHRLTESLLEQRVHRWQLDATSLRLLDLFVFLGMVSTESLGTFVLNDIRNDVSDNIARLKRHRAFQGNWIDLYYAVKFESLWSLYCGEALSLRPYDDFRLAELWRPKQLELRQLFQETYWPIFAALNEQYGLSDRFEATVQSLSSSECLAAISSVLGLSRSKTPPPAAEVRFETQLADFYGARLVMTLTARSQQVAGSATFNRTGFERLFISPFREKAVFDAFARRYASASSEKQVERAFLDYDTQLARVLAWMYPDGLPLPKITDIFPAVLTSVGLDIEARSIPYTSQTIELANQLGGPHKGAVIFIFDAFGLTYLQRLLVHLAVNNRRGYETITSILSTSQIPASTVFPTQTGPAHVSFITGCYPSEHLVFENDLRSRPQAPRQNILYGNVSVTGTSNQRLYFLDKLHGALDIRIISPYKWEGDKLPAFLTYPLDVSDWSDPNVPVAQKMYIRYDRRDESEPYQTVVALIQELASSNVPFVFVILVGDVDSLEEHQPEELADEFLLDYFGKKYVAFLEVVKRITGIAKDILVVQTADHGITAIDPARNVSPVGYSQEHFYSRGRYVEVLPNAPTNKVSEFKQQWHENILDILDHTALNRLRWRRTDLPDELVLYKPRVATLLGRQKLKGHGGISVDEMIIPLIWWST